jgi:hypothetical protein
MALIERLLRLETPRGYKPVFYLGGSIGGYPLSCLEKLFQLA